MENIIDSNKLVINNITEKQKDFININYGITNKYDKIEFENSNNQISIIKILQNYFLSKYNILSKKNDMLKNTTISLFTLVLSDGIGDLAACIYVANELKTYLKSINVYLQLQPDPYIDNIEKDDQLKKNIAFTQEKINLYHESNIFIKYFVGHDLSEDTENIIENYKNSTCKMCIATISNEIPYDIFIGEYSRIPIPSFDTFIYAGGIGIDKIGLYISSYLLNLNKSREDVFNELSNEFFFMQLSKIVDNIRNKKFYVAYGKGRNDFFEFYLNLINILDDDDNKIIYAQHELYYNWKNGKNLIEKSDEKLKIHKYIINNKTNYIFNTRLSQSNFIKLISISEPITIGTGDSSFVEMITLKKFPIYDCTSIHIAQEYPNLLENFGLIYKNKNCEIMSKILRNICNHDIEFDSILNNITENKNNIKEFINIIPVFSEYVIKNYNMSNKLLGIVFRFIFNYYINSIERNYAYEFFNLLKNNDINNFENEKKLIDFSFDKKLNSNIVFDNVNESKKIINKIVKIKEVGPRTLKSVILYTNYTIYNIKYNILIPFPDKEDILNLQKDKFDNIQILELKNKIRNIFKENDINVDNNEYYQYLIFYLANINGYHIQEGGYYYKYMKYKYKYLFFKNLL